MYHASICMQYVYVYIYIDYIDYMCIILQMDVCVFAWQFTSGFHGCQRSPSGCPALGRPPFLELPPLPVGSSDPEWVTQTCFEFFFQQRGSWSTEFWIRFRDSLGPYTAETEELVGTKRWDANAHNMKTFLSKSASERLDIVRYHMIPSITQYTSFIVHQFGIPDISGATHAASAPTEHKPSCLHATGTAISWRILKGINNWHSEGGVLPNNPTSHQPST